MSTVADIIARALQESKVWPAVFHAGSAAEGAAAVLAALEAGGFVVVPKEPNEAMKVAGCPYCHGSSIGGGCIDGAGAAYRAMLAARPKC